MTNGQLLFAVERMTLEDVQQVTAIEKASFSAPWPARAFRYEITNNEQSTMLVVRPAPRGSRLMYELLNTLGILKPSLVLGYAGFWLFVDEIHISTIAVSHQWRRRGLGELLLMALLDRGAEQGIHRVTLEVRVSNLAAQALYEHAGFEITSRQRRYYADNDEDAYIMVIPDLHEAAFQSCLGQRRDLLHARLQAGDASSPRVP